METNETSNMITRTLIWLQAIVMAAAEVNPLMTGWDM